MRSVSASVTVGNQSSIEAGVTEAMAASLAASAN